MRVSPMKGKHLSEETKLKLRQQRLGKHLSSATRKKMSEAHKRKKNDSAEWERNGQKA